MAAEELNRAWIGIDLTYLAIGAVEQQFERLFPQHNITSIKWDADRGEPRRDISPPAL